ncbi:MAG: HAMP domain-containing histidine kinase [Chloroflexia bacterium]|nr:HAMP domain-containing histidine kinase [Chloroflexia bacterium]
MKDDYHNSKKGKVVNKADIKCKIDEIVPADIKRLKTEKEQEEEIRSIIAKNNRLLTVLAHDLKTPIGSIIGFLSLIADRIETMDKPKIESSVYMALLSAKRTFALLENLLEWAFAENSLKKFKQEYTSLNDLICETKGSILLSAVQKQIEIKITSLKELQVYVDKDMIKSVLRNLLNNAIKFTHEGGEILINTTQKGDFVVVSVKDNGVGIHRDTQEIIFTSAYAESTNGTSNELGTGVGLMFCKEFLDKHGGKIWVKSEPDVGSEFKFTLPMLSN